ncbi:CRISPR-Cas system negative regulator DevI [Myxococcus virescens]
MSLRKSKYEVLERLEVVLRIVSLALIVAKTLVELVDSTLI